MLTLESSFDYPETWNIIGELKEIYLHETWNDCCDKFFGGDYELCSPDDICSETSTTTKVPETTQASKIDSSNTTPVPNFTPTMTTPFSEISPTSTMTTSTELNCISSKWHPEPVNSDGCTNSLEYPVEWEGISSLFFDTVNECCEYFRGDEHCEVYRACKEEILPKMNEAVCSHTSYGAFSDIFSKSMVLILHTKYQY